MDYKINDFEGPLDLLLHLIKESEVNICDINIEDITNQYLNFINKMEQMNLNIASDYLVMAAELMEIKSSMLLPKRQIEETDDYEEDPREQLINRLLEYEKYKNITASLKEYEHERQNIYSKEPFDLLNVIEKSDDLDESFNIDDLVKAFNNMLLRKELDKPLNTKITSKEYSMAERCIQIKKIIQDRKRVKFTELFDIKSKDYIVITFLSILELARGQQLNIKQDNNFDNIYIEEKEGI